MKIRARAGSLGYRCSSDLLDPGPDNHTKELIPCDFLRYVANGVRDDLEQFAFQLAANHEDNFPEEEVKRQMGVR